MGNVVVILLFIGVVIAQGLAKKAKADKNRPKRKPQWPGESPAEPRPTVFNDSEKPREKQVTEIPDIGDLFRELMGGGPQRPVEPEADEHEKDFQNTAEHDFSDYNTPEPAPVKSYQQPAYQHYKPTPVPPVTYKKPEPVSVPEPAAYTSETVQETKKVAAKSFDAALPKALHAANKMVRTQRHPVYISTKNLRQAVVMSEVLARPRAFDL
ncbi:MAG: hypothetical protein WCS73_02145 [Lentisphaeria bacterium]